MSLTQAAVSAYHPSLEDNDCMSPIILIMTGVWEGLGFLFSFVLMPRDVRIVPSAGEFSRKLIKLLQLQCHQAQSQL